MRVLIDECVEPRVKLLLTGHSVATVHEQGWDTLEDGPLLKATEKEFDVLLTIDGSLEFQQNFSQLQIGVLVADVPKNQVTYYPALQKELLEAAENIVPGKVIHVWTRPTPTV